MIVLDTSVIVALLRGDEVTRQKLNDLTATLAVTHPIACELYKGVYKSSKPEKGETTLEQLLDTLELLPSTQPAAKTFGRLKQKYPDLSEFDLTIAAIVHSHDATLLTRDSDFQRIDEITADFY